MSDFVRTRTAAFLGGWLCLSALTGCSSEMAKQQKAQDALAAAMQQAQIGKLPEARRWVDRAIAAAPRDIDTYISASSSDGSMTLLGIADAGDGEHGIFTSVGDDADVVSYMAQAAGKFPNNPLPLLIQEQAQGRLGDTAGQRATAARAAALLESRLTAPGHAINAALLNTLASAYWDAGDSTKGAAEFRTVIATYPHDPSVANAYNGLAYEYAVVNDKTHLPEALTLAEKALSLAAKLDPQERDSFVSAVQDTIGWVQYRLGDYKNALVNVQKGVNGLPRSAETRYHLAMIYKALGDTESARIELGYATRLSQGYAAAQRELEALPPSTPSPLAADSA